jgi:hypothetical protein
MAECHPDRRHKARGLCRQCHSILLSKQYRKLNPEKSLQTLLDWQKRNPEKVSIRIRVGNAARRRRKQDLLAGRPRPETCEVCGSPGRISWDHNHATGKFRGWLCGCCNSILGFARDSFSQLRLLANYVEEGGFGPGKHISKTLNEREIVQKRDVSHV